MTDEERSKARVTMRFEPPDVLYVSLGGDLDEADVRAVTTELRRVCEGGRRVFTLLELAHLRSVSAAGRRDAVQGMRGVTFAGSVMVGASFHIRVIATLIGKALTFVLERPLPLAFVATEPEARAWIDAQRRAGGQSPR